MHHVYLFYIYYDRITLYMRRVLRTFAIPKWCCSILSVYRHTYELVFICYTVCACWMDKCGSIISRQQPLLLPQYFNAKSKNMAMDETVKSTYIYIHAYIHLYMVTYVCVCAPKITKGIWMCVFVCEVVWIYLGFWRFWLYVYMLRIIHTYIHTLTQRLE